MKTHFKISGDQYLNNGSGIIPFELIAKEWKNKIGEKTSDGDLIIDVVEVEDNSLEVHLEILNEDNLKLIHSDGNRVSFSIE